MNKLGRAYFGLRAGDATRTYKGIESQGSVAGWTRMAWRRDWAEARTHLGVAYSARTLATDRDLRRRSSARCTTCPYGRLVPPVARPQQPGEAYRDLPTSDRARTCPCNRATSALRANRGAALTDGIDDQQPGIARRPPGRPEREPAARHRALERLGCERGARPGLAATVQPGIAYANLPTATGPRTCASPRPYRRARFERGGRPGTGRPRTTGTHTSDLQRRTERNLGARSSVTRPR